MDTEQKREQAALAVIEQGIQDGNAENGLADSGDLDAGSSDAGSDAGRADQVAGEDASAANAAGSKEEGGEPPIGVDATGAPAEPEEAGGSEGGQAGEAAAGDAPGQGKGEAAGAEEDPDFAPLAGTVKPETQERFTKLVDRVKSVAIERDEAREQVSQLYTVLSESGVTPEVFPELLAFQRGISSNDSEAMRGSLERAQKIVADLSLKLGEPAPGVDVLEGFADLKQAVQEGEITRKHAAEIAAGRRRVQAEETRREQDRGQSQQSIAIQQGKSSLTQLGRRLAQADPHYSAKYPELKRQLVNIFRDVPPEKWAERAEAYYRQIPNPTAASARPSVGDGVSQGTGKGNSIRPRQPAGGSEQAPSSALEAIEQGINAASR